MMRLRHFAGDVKYVSGRVNDVVNVDGVFTDASGHDIQAWMQKHGAHPRTAIDIYSRVSPTYTDAVWELKAFAFGSLSIVLEFLDHRAFTTHVVRLCLVLYQVVARVPFQCCSSV
jgi:hypothetical protein